MLKEKLRSRVLTVGSWITLGEPAIAEILAKAGYDWLVVDIEHSTISLEQAGELIRVIDLVGVPSLVRLTSNDLNQIKRVMDAGAHGIVVPMVNTADDARRAVAATRYAPDGVRGVGLARAQGYGATFHDYFSWQADEKNGPIVIVQIEHKDALVNLEAIMNVSGVDAFIVGPYDLSCSMGIPGMFEHPDFTKVMTFILETGKRLGRTGGLHIVEPDRAQLNDAISKGYRFIAYSADIRMLDVCARAGMSMLNER